jgi:hypothetical protein
LFKPNSSFKLGAFVTVLGRLSGDDVSQYKTSSFTDVAAGKYYLPYIEWAVANKIVSAASGGKFEPDRYITREDVAVMIYNFAKAAGYKLPTTGTANPFADDAKISSGAKSAISELRQAGVVLGNDKNSFYPQKRASKATAAAMLHRFVELVANNSK